MEKINQILALHPDWIARYALGRQRAFTMLIPEAYAAPKTMTVLGGVAVINVRGVIVKGGSPLWGDADPTQVQMDVETAAADPGVKSIMLLIDSPGGEVMGVSEAAQAIFDARQIKPIIAQVDGWAASAAYWLASQSSKIVMNKMDVVGSIGVFAAEYDYSAMFEKDGVKVVMATTGKYKGAGVPGTALTEDHQADMQRMVDQVYAQFTADVRRGRGMTAETLAPLADGRTWFGKDAVDLGLADKIQGRAATFASISRKTPSMSRAARAELELSLE